jgi:hypothetical protein
LTPLTVGLPADSFHTANDHRQGGWGTTQRSSFGEMKGWKADGRLSEAWVVADPEIVEIVSAGVAFGLDMGSRGRSDPAYSQDEWRKAPREAVEKAAAVEEKLERAREATPKKHKE